VTLMTHSVIKAETVDITADFLGITADFLG
jgi:hypothetical protein